MNLYFKRFVLLVAALAIVATTPGCAVSEKTCLQNDWQTLYGVIPDATAYRTGFDVGIALYCTTENGFSEGEDDHDYSGACPAELEKPFLRGYVDGLRIALDDLEIEYDRLSADLDDLRAHRDALRAAGLPHVRDDKRVKAASNRLSSNTYKRSSINGKMRKWRRAL